MGKRTLSNGDANWDDSTLQSIRYKRGQLQLLDQRKLPLETLYVDVPNSTAGWHAIKDMMVRGAPAIAIAACLSLAVELHNLESEIGSAEDTFAYIHNRLKYLMSSRPTAVNLSEAAKKLDKVAEKAADSSSSADMVIEAYIHAAEDMLADDVMANKALGAYGTKLILENAKNCRSRKGLRILTHCNTGSLATAAYGTALGVIRALHSQGQLETAYCTETRPYNQGSRLTAFEFVHDKVPAVLIADSAAASLQLSGRIDAVIVGADRIASNGDTANKIGTYSLALSAFHHSIPFYVAAPLTSIDMSLSSGKNIVIEERPSQELTHSNGGQGPQIAASGISVWNPAFDITPAKLITAIITDKGVITKNQGSDTFDIQCFRNKLDMSEKSTNSSDLQAVDSVDTGVLDDKTDFDVSKGTQPFRILDEKSLVEYIVVHPNLARILGGDSGDWKVREVGDGNLNFVYIVLGPNGSLVIKQSVPYVRCVGESWPLSEDRAYYEALVLKEHGRICPDHVPEIYHFNRSMGTIAMRYLEPPHIILRKGLIAGIRYPYLAEHMSDYMSRTLYYTSLIALSTDKHKPAVAQFCGNVELCRLTEQVIFTEPYMVAANNRWTTPHLDEDVKSVREDVELKLEIADLKSKFCERTQALIHGDLHSGSIMATITSTQVIDPEFGFYGPIGFDVGAFVGNLIIAYYSQSGHATYDNDRQEYSLWILSIIEKTWTLFERKFISLWTTNWENSGDAYPSGVYKSAVELELAQKRYMKEIFQDSIGFAAAKIIRRIVGIAHVEDFESIENPDRRARCERQALNFAKTLMKGRHSISSIHQLIEVVQGGLQGFSVC
eukprot:c28009_g1_i1 orf=420-2933(-)